MKEKLTIVKIGGNVIDDDESLKDFVNTFASIEGQKLLVHGGGKIATKMAGQLGIASQMIDGRRVTDDDMIDIVVMTYAGLINKRIVALLNKEAVQAIGLSGADGNAILANKRPVTNGVDYGWVGDVEQVNESVLKNLMMAKITPVFCALTHDGDGQLLNTNADTIANAVAIAMATTYEVSLNYCFELNGVMGDLNDPRTLVKKMDLQSYRKLKEEGTIAGGMIPKLDNAFEAIQKGVAKVNILNVEALAQLNNTNYDAYTTLY